jgi:antitoxin (DNA-binding transcriptional repressor) of toxin-antitoxin stability system
MDQVHKDGIPLTVTKRGKPLVRVTPIRNERRRHGLKGTIVYETKDIFSTGESWEADR